MDLITDKCQICGSTDGFKHSNLSSFFGDLYDCPKCGKYYIEMSAEEDFKTKKLRSAMYYYLRNIHKGNKKTLFVCKEVCSNVDYQTITVDNLLQYYPKDVNERIDKILENLYYINQEFASYISLASNYIENSAIFFTDKEDRMGIADINNTLSMLNKLELIKSVNSDLTYFIIDFKGWERLDKINQQKMKTKKAFIAMWFDEKMSEFREAIKEAIIESGYVPIIIDEKQHNNQIVPEILYEIKTSDFIIADLTGNRNGVYYEAGYALGKGKEVIFLLNNEIDKETHFDVAQQNQIRYESVKCFV